MPKWINLVFGMRVTTDDNCVALNGGRSNLPQKGRSVKTVSQDQCSRTEKGSIFFCFAKFFTKYVCVLYSVLYFLSTIQQELKGSKNEVVVS